MVEENKGPIKKVEGLIFYLDLAPQFKVKYLEIILIYTPSPMVYQIIIILK